MRRSLLSLLCGLAVLSPPAGLQAQQSSLVPPARLTLPPSLSAAGSAAVVNGASWGYVVWQANAPEWYQQYDVAVYLKPGAADVEGTFTLQGVISPLTDPAAIGPWLNRAAALATATGGTAEDLEGCADLAGQLLQTWGAAPAGIPADLKLRLAMLGNRAVQRPPAAASLRQLGNSHPVFRFVTGTAWAGPLNVPVGQDATLELRQRERASGAEGPVVGRVTLRAVNLANRRLSPETLPAPGAPLQVPPDWISTVLPVPNETPLPIPPVTTLPDLAVPLRWSIPESLRRQVLLTRGFHLWSVPVGATYTDISALLAAESMRPPVVFRLLRNPGSATKLFKASGSAESGPLVDDFASDRATWFFVDDHQRYDFVNAPPPGTAPAFTGTPYADGQSLRYYAAPVDLLGRYGALSAAGGGIAVRTVPPQVPEVLRVDNIMTPAGQRLRVAWKPNVNRPEDVATTAYLVFRDRVKNTESTGHELEKSTNPNLNNSMIYLGTVAHPTTPGAELSFDDVSLAPQIAADYGRTYFYCIRAVRTTPLGLNASAPSPPVFGTLRDRAGPPPPTGYLNCDAPRVGLTFADETPVQTANSSLPDDTVLLRFRCERADKGVESVKLRATLLSGESLEFVATLPELHFGSSDVVVYDFPASLRTLQKISAVGTTVGGRIGHVVEVPFPAANFEEKNTYTIRVLTTSKPVIGMIPVGNFYWTKYFKRADNSDSVFTISPLRGADGTYTAAFPGAIDGTRSRALLIQRNVGGIWSNFASARLPAGEAAFSFNNPATVIGGATFRVWEVIDPPGSQDAFTLLHDPRPAGFGEVLPLAVTLVLPPGAHEYRLYRRSDDGPLFQIQQGAGSWDPAAVKTFVFNDGVFAPAGGRIGYYGQTFDQHGNPSPLVLLEQKVGVIPDLPVPVLDAGESGGTVADPRLLIRATAPSPGIERMELKITPPPETTVGMITKSYGAGLLFNFKPGGTIDAPQDFASTLLPAAVAVTPPDQPFIYSPSVRVKVGVKYVFQVRALGVFGTQGEWSAPQEFTWNEPLVAGAIAWPARPLPAIVNWNPGISAFLPESINYILAPNPSETASGQRIIYGFPTVNHPVAVQIGSIPLTNNLGAVDAANSNWEVFGGAVFNDNYGGLFGLRGVPGFAAVNGPANLFHQFLFPKLKSYGDIAGYDFSQKLLPVVLYRQQISRRVAETTVATPTADIVQVSPMISSIAWRPEPTTVRNGTTLANFATFQDPFVGVVRRSSITNPPYQLALCLYDTAPVASGATYRYYLVHFADDGEPDGIIDVGNLFIPVGP